MEVGNDGVVGFASSELVIRVSVEKPCGREERRTSPRNQATM